MRPRPIRILVPPGIGDGYWVFVKLRGFLASHGISMPELWVHDQAPASRSAGFWQRVPFVRFMGSGQLAKKDLYARRAYRPPGIPVQRRVHSWDYFLSFNGSLESGRSLDAALPGPTNWYESLTRPANHDETVAGFRSRFGRYVACAFWDHGFYRSWLSEFGEARIVDTLRLIVRAGYTPVLMGAGWDRDGIGTRIAAADPAFVDLVGETDFDQLTALLEGAAGVLGFPAGNSILGPYFRRPTVLLWHEHFHRQMWRNVCPPDPHYRTMATRDATPDGVAGTLRELMEAA